MNKRSWWQSLARLTLWAHVIGVAGFYLINWQRTRPAPGEVVQALPGKTRKMASIGPTVSVIVPARNEERNIERCVSSLLEQDYDHYEVIVVDDGSTDATGRILDQLAQQHPNGHRLWVLQLRDLPEGWAGKPHAIHRGVQEAQGDWLLFTDADTWHAPNALRSTLTQAIQEGSDMFTIGAEQELPSFWDRALMPMAYMGISMLYPPKLVNDPKSSVAVANGQYILIRHAVYNLIGGYARPDLRGTLLDDRDLARVVKENGFKLHFLDGSGLVHVHMYSTLREIWHGWRKNAYLGNRGGLLFVVLQLIGLPTITIAPFLLPLLAFFTRNNKHASISTTEVGIATALELTPLLAYRAWLNGKLAVPWYYSVTHPLAGIIFTGILGQSTWRVLTRKGVDWRGRQYHNGNGDKDTEPASKAAPH